MADSHGKPGPDILSSSTTTHQGNRFARTYLRCGNADLGRTRSCQPLLIYSRFDLNRLMLERAEAAGARLEKTRVTALDRTSRAGQSVPGLVRLTPIIASSQPEPEMASARSEPSGSRATLSAPSDTSFRTSRSTSTCSSSPASKAIFGFSRARAIFLQESRGRENLPPR